MYKDEAVIETKVCKHCNCAFEITDKDVEFYGKVSPVFGGKKYLVPAPILCPDCRQQRRLSFRNERKLYKRKCDKTEKPIISIYSPNKPYTVYSQETWWSDCWAPLDYGRDFDFSKSFFEQFEGLMKEVPRLCLHVIGNENSDFVNHCGYSKGCYMSFNTDFSENCYYSKNAFKCTNCIDVFNADNSENCYASVDIKSCYNGFFVQECKESSHIYYSYNLLGCNYCFACVNLTNKQYCILNTPYSKDEYFEKVLGLKTDFSSILEEYTKLRLESPHIYANIKDSENVTGNNLINVTDAQHCFDCFSDESVAYCSTMSDAKYMYDFDVGGYYSELHYEAVSSGDKNLHCCFDTNVWGNSSYVYYSDVILGSSHLFGCTGLRNKSYCILNKQYSKEEYELLVPRIIEHMVKTREWGEFFPASVSPFGYAETVANEYFPLTKEEAIKNNFKWSDYESPFPKVVKVIPANKLPKNIADIPDDILNWAIECEVTKKPFRIIKQELEFYRKQNLPIPKRHPDQRYLDRMKLRNPRKLYKRECYKCRNNIETTYAPQRLERVYCEECYNEEIVL